MLSIIIPTFNERENVIEISNQIADVFKETPYEIVFVDDSIDDTPSILEKLCETDKHVRFEHRVKDRSLSTAVIRGFQIAQGEILAVMDADLQHPPEMLYQMLNSFDKDVDIVIPSRFIPGGNDGGLSFIRKIISAGARYLGKIFLKALRHISDPTGGFFMFRREVIKGVQLQPVGWKILIEILARGKYSKVVEIPYTFQSRNAGESKMSLKEQWNYLYHLWKLVQNSPEDRRFFLFALVGLSGVMVNLLIYIPLVSIHVNVLISSIIAAFIAMVSNFTLNNNFTWQGIKTDSLMVRFMRFGATSLLGIGINLAVLFLLNNKLLLNYIFSNLMGIAAATIWNYIVNNLWTWKSKSEKVSVLRRREISQKF